VLAAGLARVAPDLVDGVGRAGNESVPLRPGVTGRQLAAGLAAARHEFGAGLHGMLPDVDERAVEQLKFAELLPPDLAHATLAARLADHDAAARVIERGMAEVRR
jgi:ATP-dependent Lhr-like helicase